MKKLFDFIKEKANEAEMGASEPSNEAESALLLISDWLAAVSHTLQGANSISIIQFFFLSSGNLL